MRVNLSKSKAVPKFLGVGRVQTACWRTALQRALAMQAYDQLCDADTGTLNAIYAVILSVALFSHQPRCYLSKPGQYLQDVSKYAYLARWKVSATLCKFCLWAYPLSLFLSEALHSCLKPSTEHGRQPPP